MANRAVYIYCLALIACGGAGSNAPAAKTSSGGKADNGPSIGDLAAAQGGLSALGGAGNREDGGSTGIEVAMGGALRAEEVDRKSTVKLDGVLKEWPERTNAGETLSGK